MNQTINFISGPTAIGKSCLAIKLAKKIGGIIVNADSMQIYKNLSILTARPKKEDEEAVPHELYGYIDGSNRYNVAKWCNDVLKIIDNKKIKAPIILVGGSGMYIESLLRGLIELPSIPELYKKKSEELLKDIGLKM